MAALGWRAKFSRLFEQKTAYLQYFIR